ncbi:MAG: glycoside hydrolase family 18 [Clostridia bacterium]|jgi:GH18 family chitinase/alkyl hydroperoxide reductase subunit AhpC|nr:glycoside hydrolase family 18 [Clostridia bacterium]
MTTMPKVGGKSIAFTAASTHGLINLSDYAGKWVVLFCNPGEFTSKHKDDLTTFIKYYKEFSKRDIELIGLSTDQNAAHLQWLYSVYRTKVTAVPFPIIDDRKGTIGKLFGISSSGYSARDHSTNIFIISPNQTLVSSSNYVSLSSIQISEIFKKLNSLRTTYDTNENKTANRVSGVAPGCNVKPIVGEYVLGNPENVDPRLLDFVIYAFVQIKPDGTFEAYSTRYLTELAALRSVNPNLKVLMAIGGWGAEGFSDAALTPTSRYAFAREAKRWVDEYNLDGVDLDWEYPGNSVAGIKSRPADRENFTLLITALRDVLGPNKWITVAGTGDPLYIRNVEISKIAPLINYFNLMAYDFNAGETGETAGKHQANLFPSDLSLGTTSVDGQITNLTAAGMPARKILMGIPFYGRYGATSTRTFDDLRRNFINTNGYTVRWDDVAKAAYIVGPTGNFAYSYDNPISIYYKGVYAADECLGGLFSWQAGMDTANILAAAMSDAVRDLDGLRETLITEYSFTP